MEEWPEVFVGSRNPPNQSAMLDYSEQDAPILVVGRFPPPIDGQTMATHRLADLVSASRVNIEPTHTAKSRAGRLLHFLRIRSGLKRDLAKYPKATILWPSISPDPAGHFRDISITLPSFRADQRIFAISHRGTFHKMFESPLTKATALLLSRRVNKFVFLSKGLADQCAPWIPDDKRLVIPNTIDAETVLPRKAVEVKRRERVKQDKLSVLFVGHMMPSKGYLDTLEAIRILAARSAPIEAHFAGGWQKPEDQEAFMNYVRTHNLKDIVFHHGAVSNRKAMRALHRNADVLMLPTWYRNEAQPLVIIEALNAGTPVISTSYRAIPDMVEHGAGGYLVPPRNPEAIAKALENLCEPTRWTKMSIWTRQRFENTFSPERVREQWLKATG